MTEPLWDLADICATTRFADDMVVRTSWDDKWSTTAGKLRSLSANVIARASNATTPDEAKAILNAAFKAQMRAAEAKSYAPPDPYAKDIAAMRAASATSETFEDAYKNLRQREFDQQRDRMSAHVAAHPSAPRLTTAETKTYAPPDPWAADLAKMKEKR